MSEWVGIYLAASIAILIGSIILLTRSLKRKPDSSPEERIRNIVKTELAKSYPRHDIDYILDTSEQGDDNQADINSILRRAQSLQSSAMLTRAENHVNGKNELIELKMDIMSDQIAAIEKDVNRIRNSSITPAQLFGMLISIVLGLMGLAGSFISLLQYFSKS